QTIAIIETEANATAAPTAEPAKVAVAESATVAQVAQTVEAAKTATAVVSSDDRFYSPLVRNIAKQEGISQSQLDAIVGTGKDGRVTKNDILNYIENKTSQPAQETPKPVEVAPVQDAPKVVTEQAN